MAHRDTSVSELCRELGIGPVTPLQVRRTAGPTRPEGPRLLNRKTATLGGHPLSVGLRPLPQTTRTIRQAATCFRGADQPGRGRATSAAARTRWWWTHGLPPQSGTVTADTPPSASPRSAVPAAMTSAPAGGTTGATRLSVPSPPPAGRRGSREPEPVDKARAAASTPGSTSRPTTASASPVEPHRLPAERSPATAGGAGTDVRGDRPGRSPRSPSSGIAPPPPAAVAAVPWQPHRPPPHEG